MNSKLKLAVMFLGVAIAVAGCTKNQRAREFGGAQTIDLPAGRSLVTATWKDHDLWILTRERSTNVPPATSTFEEKSSFGLLQGKITFTEH